MPTSKRATRSAPRPYHHGNLRRALLDEALATIAADGVDAVTLREIGARVGVSRTALYRHFADKRALLAAVATEGFQTLRERLLGAWEDGNRSDAGFRAMGVAYVQFALDNPSHYRVMFGPFVDSETQDAELATEAHGAFQALVDALVARQHAGAARRDDALQMASYVWALVHGLAMLAIDGKLPEPVSIEGLTDYALDRLRSGIER